MGTGSPFAAGAVLGGRFRVERVLGAGAMGVVVAAEHLALRERVALPQLCMAIVTGAPASLRALRPDVPQPIERLVLACLEKDRNRRLASVAEFAQELAP